MSENTHPYSLQEVFRQGQDQSKRGRALKKLNNSIKGFVDTEKVLTVP